MAKQQTTEAAFETVLVDSLIGGSNQNIPDAAMILEPLRLANFRPFRVVRGWKWTR